MYRHQITDHLRRHRVAAKTTLEWHRAIYVPPHSFDMIVVQITSIASWKKTTRLEGSICISKNWSLASKYWFIDDVKVLPCIIIIHSLHLSFRCGIWSAFSEISSCHKFLCFWSRFEPSILYDFLNTVYGCNASWILSWCYRGRRAPWKQHGAVSVWRWWSCQWKVVLQLAVKTLTWAVGGYLILRHRVLKHTFMYSHPCVHVSILCHIQIYTVYEQSYWIGTILSRYVGYGIGHDIHSIYFCRYKTYNYKRQ